jgi:hypothetical protein
VTKNITSAAGNMLGRPAQDPGRITLSHAWLDALDRSSVRLARTILVNSEGADYGCDDPCVFTAQVGRLQAGLSLLLDVVDRATAAPCTSDTAGKDTAVTRGASTLSSDVRDLLTAIRDALDVPLPGIEDSDERAYHRLLDLRRTAVHVALTTWLDSDDRPIRPDDTAYIRRRTAETPVTYTVYVPAPKRGESR